MFAQNIDYFKSKPVNIPKITVMVDYGYHSHKLISALELSTDYVQSKASAILIMKPILVFPAPSALETPKSVF